MRPRSALGLDLTFPASVSEATGDGRGCGCVMGVHVSLCTGVCEHVGCACVSTCDVCVSVCMWVCTHVSMCDMCVLVNVHERMCAHVSMCDVYQCACV